MNKRELDLKLSKMRSTIVIIENRMNEIVKVKGNDFNELNPGSIITNIPNVY